MYGKLEKLTERFLAKLHPSNLVNTTYCLSWESVHTYFNLSTMVTSPLQQVRPPKHAPTARITLTMAS